MIRKVTRIKKEDRLLINRFTNRFTKGGKRDMVLRAARTSLIKLKLKRGKAFKGLLRSFFNILRPAVQLKPRFASGLIYMLPAPLATNKEYTMALGWFFRAVEQRPEHQLTVRMTNELFDVFIGRGRSVTMKIEYYKQIIANRVLMYRFRRRR